MNKKLILALMAGVCGMMSAAVDDATRSFSTLGGETLFTLDDNSAVDQIKTVKFGEEDIEFVITQDHIRRIRDGEIVEISSIHENANWGGYSIELRPSGGIVKAQFSAADAGFLLLKQMQELVIDGQLDLTSSEVRLSPLVESLINWLDADPERLNLLRENHEDKEDLFVRSCFELRSIFLLALTLTRFISVEKNVNINMRVLDQFRVNPPHEGLFYILLEEMKKKFPISWDDIQIFKFLGLMSKPNSDKEIPGLDGVFGFTGGMAASDNLFQENGWTTGKPEYPWEHQNPFRLKKDQMEADGTEIRKTKVIV